MAKSRCSGILLHPTALPGPFGIGDFGPSAYDFIEFLKETDQQLWQVLPLNHTGFGNSPYMCLSAYAGSPALVSLQLLAKEGLLDPGEIARPPAFPAQYIDFGWALGYKMPFLMKAFSNFKNRYTDKLPDEFYAFIESNAFWLEDYALFAALKDFHHGLPWTQWERDARVRNPDALAGWRNRLMDEIRFWMFVQYLFFKQWASVREYCRAAGIRIIGDIPLYVAHDSAEVWSKPELFQLDAQGQPLVIAGVPPDYFSSTGQRWGNPIYRWDRMADEGYDWWIDRFRINLLLVDVLRLDHFRGFEAYWEIPADEPTAVNGRWVKGPGAKLFKAVEAKLGKIEIIAEDLGVITPEVDILRDRLGYPGMRILQMAFGNDPKAGDYRPHNYTRNCVCYTATHDHNTTLGWFTAAPGTQTTQSHEEIRSERSAVLQYLNTDGSEIHWDFIRMAIASVADTAIFPLQDVLGLPSAARMNLPGTSQGNWQWRFESGMLTAEIRDRLKTLTGIYGRAARLKMHCT